MFGARPARWNFTAVIRPTEAFEHWTDSNRRRSRLRGVLLESLQAVQYFRSLSAACSWAGRHHRTVWNITLLCVGERLGQGLLRCMCALAFPLHLICEAILLPDLTNPKSLSWDVVCRHDTFEK